jgi:hypothetical protein
VELRGVTGDVERHCAEEHTLINVVEVEASRADEDAPEVAGNHHRIKVEPRERLPPSFGQALFLQQRIARAKEKQRRTDAIITAALARLEAGAYSSSDEDERYWYRDEDNEAPPTKLRKLRKLHDSASASHDGAAEDTSLPRTAGVFCGVSLQALRAKIEVQIAQHSTKGK